MPVPHDDSGTFFFVNTLSSQAGHGDPSQPRRDAVRQIGDALARGAPRRARPAARPGRRRPARGGPLSAGAGIPAGGALSAGAGIAAGRRFVLRARDRGKARQDEQGGTQRAGHGRLRFWGGREARAIIHTTVELPGSRGAASSGKTRAPMLCCAAMCRAARETHFENRDLHNPRKVIACRRRRTRCRGRRVRCARAITSAAISCWSRIGTGGMAEVFRAIAQGVQGFEREFVIKRIRPDKSDSPNFVQMFCEEARISALLQSPEHRAGLRLRSHRRRVLHGDGASRRRRSVGGDAHAARAGRRDAAVGRRVRGARGGARPSSRAHAGAARRNAGRRRAPRRHAVQHHVAARRAA